MLQPSFKTQNDKVYAASLSDVPANRKSVQRFQNAQGVMVWGAISRKGVLPLLFIDKGVKINANYYLNEVLKGHVLRYALSLFGSDNWGFQQDSAPSHAAKIVQSFCEQNFPGFIDKTLWPPSSPDANPLDFSKGEIMDTKLRDLKPMNIDQFKKLLQKIWNEIPEGSYVLLATLYLNVLEPLLKQRVKGLNKSTSNKNFVYKYIF